MMVDRLNNPSILSSLVLPRKSFCFDVPDFFFLFLSLKGRIIGGGTRLGGVVMSLVFVLNVVLV